MPIYFADSRCLEASKMRDALAQIIYYGLYCRFVSGDIDSNSSFNNTTENVSIRRALLFYAIINDISPIAADVRITGDTACFAR